MTTLNFERNGDIIDMDSDTCIGRIDSDGDVQLHDDAGISETDVLQALHSVLVRCLPGHVLSGNLDWTPSIDHLRAVGWEDRYTWDNRRHVWVEADKYNVLNAGGVILNLDGPLDLDAANELAEEIEIENDIDVFVKPVE